MIMLQRLSLIMGVLFIYSFSHSQAMVKTAFAATQQIVAVVNEDAISGSDLGKRMRLIMASSGLPNTDEIRQKLVSQVLRTLINEALMMQEAKKINANISKEEIDAGLVQIAQQNNLKPEQFLGMLQKGGIDPSTMYDQVKAQVAWGKVIQAKLRPRVTISSRDVDDILERIKAKIGTTEYLSAEIFLPVENPKEEARVRKLANEMVREIKSGKASFFKLAQQFSQSAGSMNGGDKGWVNESQLSEELLAGLAALEKNQVSKPIKAIDGYHILFLRDKRTLTEDTVPSRQQIEYNIGSERMDKLQRRHLMDLRLSSFIEIRIK